MSSTNSLVGLGPVPRLGAATTRGAGFGRATRAGAPATGALVALGPRDFGGWGSGVAAAPEFAGASAAWRRIVGFALAGFACHEAVPGSGVVRAEKAGARRAAPGGSGQGHGANALEWIGLEEKPREAQAAVHGE